MSELQIVNDKDKLDIGMFRTWNFELADITLAINQSDAFVAVEDGAVVAQCLVKEKADMGDVTHFVYSNQDAASEMLKQLSEHYRQKGLASLEVGCGNASLEPYILFQRAGFRVVGVVTDYYVSDNKNVSVENSIANLDMVRFRCHLQEKRFSTLGHNASGVK